MLLACECVFVVLERPGRSRRSNNQAYKNCSQYHTNFDEQKMRFPDFAGCIRKCRYCRLYKTPEAVQRYFAPAAACISMAISREIPSN
jgi:hypothetical protein